MYADKQESKAACKPEITFVIDGKKISRSDVIPYEMERCRIAAERLGVKLPDDISIEYARRAVLERKLDLGHEAIGALCAADIRKAKTVVQIMRKLSFGKVKPCRVEVMARGISAKQFIEWFENVNAKNDEATLLAAHPEHYLITNAPAGRQHIIETNGGAPFTAEFTIDFSDKKDALAKQLPDYPYHIAGKAVDDHGKRVGGSM